MKKTMLALLPAAALALAWPPPAMAGTLQDGDLLALQVTLQSYIDASLVNGALLSVDAESGKTVQYFPTKAHPKVMALGNDYVMCAEVVDAEGKASMADFYITRNGGTFVVFQSVVGHDPLLEKLMADNRVSMAN